MSRPYGRESSFTDPCLTAAVAAAASAWLDAAATGPSPMPERLLFTEPNAAGARLQVRFSHESLAPWVPRDRLTAFTQWTQNRKMAAARSFASGCAGDMLQITCPRRNEYPRQLRRRHPK